MRPLSRRAVLAASAAMSTAVVRAGTVRTLDIGIVSDPVTLDPAFAGSFFENEVLYNLHETLLVAGPDGALEPGLAESWEQPDRLRLRLMLRPGLTFHDGTALDAAAVKANLDRVLDPHTGSIRRNDLGPVSEVAVIGPRAVEFRLSDPYAPLPSVLANRAGMIVSPSGLARLGPDFAAHAIGCGAFRLASWTRNNALVMERFDGYWRGAAPGFDRLTFRPLPDDSVRVANLPAGTVQLIDGVPPQDAADLARDPAYRLAQMPSIGFNALSLNCVRAPFADRRVRRAFARAIDPEPIQRLVYFNTGSVARGPISPSIAWAFDPALAPPAADPEAAKTLLAHAGAQIPVPIALTITSTPLARRIGEVIQAQAARAGFDLTLHQVDPTGLLSVLRRRDFDAAMSPWSGRFDPDGNMFFWFVRDGFTNFSGYDDKDVESLLLQARASSDQLERRALYHRAQAIVVEDAPVVFLHFDAILQAGTAGLHWTLHADGVLRLFDASMTRS